MSKIFFFNADKTVSLKNKNVVKHLISNLFETEAIPLQRINYIFCSDDYLFEINQQYLNHKSFTDIITFPFSEADSPVFAEIYISAERIKENAKIYSEEYQNELLRVIIHGALHLCGYKDKTKLDKAKMRARENHFINQFKGFT